MISNYNNLLDPKVLSELPNLTLRLKSVVAYLNNGLHRTMHKGSSIEFSEHKQYSPGDEPKWIDWKFFAKTDKYYIKQFENESSLSAYFLIDSSASMGYQGIDDKGLSKLDYGAILLASLTYILVKNKDQVGLVTSKGNRPHIIPSQGKSDHIFNILKRLESLIPEKGEERLNHSIKLLSEKLQKRGIVVIISDLLEEGSHILNAIKLLKQKKQKVILIHILHNTELTFPFVNTTEMFDMEDDNAEKITVEPSRIRQQYLKELKNFIDWWKKETKINGIEYHLVDTSLPMHLPLIDILSSKGQIK